MAPIVTGIAVSLAAALIYETGKFISSEIMSAIEYSKQVDKIKKAIAENLKIESIDLKMIDLNRKIETISKKFYDLKSIWEIAGFGSVIYKTSDEVQNFTNIAINTGEALKLNNKDAGRIVGKIAANYNLAPKELYIATNSIVNVAEKMQIRGKDLLEGTLVASNRAERFGLSAENTGALIAPLLQKNTNPNVAGETINSILFALMNPPQGTKQLKESFEKHKLNYEKYKNKREKEPQAALFTLLRDLHDIKGVERGQAINDIFGDINIESIEALISNFDKIEKSVSVAIIPPDINRMDKKFTTKGTKGNKVTIDQKRLRAPVSTIRGLMPAPSPIQNDGVTFRNDKRHKTLPTNNHEMPGNDKHSLNNSNTFNYKAMIRNNAAITNKKTTSDKKGDNSGDLAAATENNNFAFLDLAGCNYEVKDQPSTETANLATTVNFYPEQSYPEQPIAEQSINAAWTEPIDSSNRLLPFNSFDDSDGASILRPISSFDEYGGTSSLIPVPLSMGATNTNTFNYSPTINAPGGDEGNIRSALEKDRSEFTRFIEQGIENYFARQTRMGMGNA